MIKRKLIDGYPFVAYQPEEVSADEMKQRSLDFYTRLQERRSIRDFSDRPVPREVIESVIRTAATAPSGAHKQPWTFCVVENQDLKKDIREAAEKEEYESYTGRMPEEWLADLRPLQTDWQKPFLTTAPFLIVVFKKSYELKEDGRRGNVYYGSESCGLACGFLLKRPENEKPFLLIPVGYAAEDCWVPDLQRKALEEVSVWY